jgi:hypothetical protein
MISLLIVMSTVLRKSLEKSFEIFVESTWWRSAYDILVHSSRSTASGMQTGASNVDSFIDSDDKAIAYMITENCSA